MKTIILKDIKTGKYYKVKQDPLYKDFLQNVKVGDNVIYRYRLELKNCKVIKIIDRVKKPKGIIFSESMSIPLNWKPHEYIMQSIAQAQQCMKPPKMGLLKLIEKEEKEKKRRKEELTKLRKRPYFLTRVDFVKGNPSRKENLEKIEFPCFCEFDVNKGIHGGETHGQGVKGIGEINKTFTNDQVEYQLSRIDYQQKGLSVICSTPSLKRLFEIYDIEILKGEIQIWKKIK